jgi:hypothetical protein
MVRIVNASVTPPTVAIKPKGIMPSEAIVQLGVVDDSGHGVAAADVLLVVDNGLISKYRETWGPTLSVKTDEHGSAYAWFDAKFEAVVRPGSAKIVAIIGPSTKPDDVISKDISIIGPPASVLVSAAPTRLQPGEIVTIKAVVKDAIGQEVPNGTQVKFSATPEG